MQNSIGLVHRFGPTKLRVKFFESYEFLLDSPSLRFWLLIDFDKKQEAGTMNDMFDVIILFWVRSLTLLD